ncbi:MAG TPA: hypothetical protein VGF43_20275, partial [Dongiaceae bacterium]
PVATIGVRGTEFLVHVDGGDATVIDILSGAVEAKPNGTGKAVTCVGGQSILVADPDQDAMCGDIGSFSTAAGSSGPDRSPEPGHNESKGAGNGGNNAHEPPHSDPPGGDGGGSGGDGGGGDGGGELSDSGIGLPLDNGHDPDFG